MRTVALKYRLDTGRVFGFISSTDEDLMGKQVSRLKEGVSVIVAGPDHPAVMYPDQWIVSNGELKEKELLTILPSKQVINADGVDEAIVSVSPSVAITLMVDDEGISLAEGEPLMLTSDTPKRFRVHIDSANYYAADIYIEAM